MDAAITAFDDGAIAFAHRWNLVALVWMHQKHDFIVTHKKRLLMDDRAFPLLGIRQGEDDLVKLIPADETAHHT
jgi:hypothetical protein